MEAGGEKSLAALRGLEEPRAPGLAARGWPTFNPPLVPHKQFPTTRALRQVEPAAACYSPSSPPPSQQPLG